MSTDVTKLRAIYETEKSDGQLATFVTAGNLIVDENLVTVGLSASRRDLIATYLAAHFLAISEQGGAIRKRIGEADETYPKEKGLDSTPFGQQALLLDTSGTLAALLAGSMRRARFEVV